MCVVLKNPKTNMNENRSKHRNKMQKTWQNMANVGNVVRLGVKEALPVRKELGVDCLSRNIWHSFFRKFNFSLAQRET